jgi:hypothetical protein
MLVGAKVLSNFNNSNSFDYSSQFEYNQGTNDTLYIQFVNLGKKLCGDIYQRYMVPAGSTVTIRIDHIDQSCTIERIATVDANDQSIWSIPLLPTDKIGSGNIHFEIQEPGSNVRKGVIKEGIVAYPVDPDNTSYC